MSFPIKRLAICVAALLLAIPAAAQAASPGQGVVLAVNARSHVLELVDGRHVVHAFHFGGRVRSLEPGTHVSFLRTGIRITHLRRTGGGSVTFYAKVLHAGSDRIVVKLGDGRTLRLPASHASSPGWSAGRHHLLAHLAADTVVTHSVLDVSMPALHPGTTVAVTETPEAPGQLVITVSLPAGYPVPASISEPSPMALPLPVGVSASATGQVASPRLPAS